MIKTILLILLMIPISAALSENIHLTGQIDAWHDGVIKDRASGTGTIQYAAEGYPGGFSSGFDIQGKGGYYFGSRDYSVELRDFSGSMVAESDLISTTVDGNGTGQIKTKSFGKPGVLVHGFPIGEINGYGVFEIHVNTAGKSTNESSIMDTNSTEGAPVGIAIPAYLINASSRIPI